MSISGSMYAGISGLTVHSQAMSVIGNNLANSSTIGYKSATTQFEDVFYSTVSTANGLNQVGHGATVSSIYQNFAQGSYESSTSDTAVAIGGNGFFMVNNPTTGSRYYTRAGNFEFDQYGYLVDAHGYRVQGWKAAEKTSSAGVVQTQGALTDLRLTSYQSPPSATSKISLSVNLDKTDDDNSTNTANPFFAMFSEWDGSDDTPIGDSKYAYQTTITVYDEAGTGHELTVYFDRVSDPAVTSQAGGYQVWEYIVTCDPTSDGRTVDGQKVGTTSAAGLLMAGTITFNSSGIMQGMTAFTLGDGATGDLKDLNSWTPAEFSDNGYPVFTANFSGSPNANFTTDANAKTIELNLGLQNDGTGWNGATANAAALGNDFTSLFNVAQPDLQAGASTAYDSASSTYDQNQNGYATGYLQGISVDRDGVVSGQYSNGRIINLFVLALADFNNPQGLILQGGNLYSEGSDSGSARIGRANTSSYGSISANTLEQSNVDMSTEMVRLITTQRGYQANSKVITTADTMLQEAINLKR
ncbi:flagellar hook protein FlgE [Desulfovibrio psychrotolerans]|uniref:Flagellar hook protein FlgE n=1 Tax=Desulfovibrio psychrotolerans TaxID=415242 RepID=A0A7J0BXN4_9BACT|nr:flagellar hook protein FlgE [Desulfovibrio psychrotolerans]GFM38456.1 flagellar hook protein FlgE [Desulfovibrio psychrotolerans]